MMAVFDIRLLYSPFGFRGRQPRCTLLHQYNKAFAVAGAQLAQPQRKNTRRAAAAATDLDHKMTPSLGSTHRNGQRAIDPLGYLNPGPTPLPIRLPHLAPVSLPHSFWIVEMPSSSNFW